MHVAIITDGNGRWATQRKLPRTAGHIEVGRSSDMPIAPVMIYGDDASRVVTKKGFAYLFKTDSGQADQNLFASHPP
jgi:undecaprenyl diphosphate synthase